MAIIPLHPAGPRATDPAPASARTPAPGEAHLSEAHLSEAHLPEAQRRALRCLAGLMIPASAEYGVPGADDELIFADLLATIGPQAGFVAEVLARLDGFAGVPFGDADEATRQAAAGQLRDTRGSGAAQMVALVAQCYYRDERVMRSLGMEVRPPFPAGFDVEQGDWSLLAPVRARGKMYRDAP